MLCIRDLYVAMLMLLGSALFLPRDYGFSQTNGAKTSPSLSLPVSLEWNESFNPRAQSKLATDGFKFRGGYNNLKLQFSTQAPAILGGKQFQWMPGGYQLADFSLSRKWGSIQGFRSLRYSARSVRPDIARTITGAGVEAPKSIFGTRMAAYFVHADPTDEARQVKNFSLAGARGSQVGLTVVRDFRKKARLQAEWTESWHESRLSSSKYPSGFFSGARRAFMMGFEGTLARTEFSSTFITRDEGLANPAAPSYGPGKQNLRLNARRKFKGHQFQYSVQSDGQRASPILGVVCREVREHTAGWNYAPKRLPQIAASQTLSRQIVAGKREEERGFRLSLAKSIRGITAGIALFRALRYDLHLSRPLWHRTVLSADAAIEIRKGKRLHLRYETNALEQHTFAQKVASSSLQMDTRVNVWGDKVALTPTLDFRRQQGALPAHRQSSARVALSALLKVPRWIPGTDLLVNFASNHTRSTGRPDWNRVDLTMRWNFKRF